MKIKERLLECKVMTGIKSDYKLAEALGTRRQVVSELMNGKRKPDAYIAVKIADILKLHPLMLVAEFEADIAKDEKKKAFWLNFGQRIKTGAIGMLALIFTAFWLPGQRAEAAMLDTHNVYYVKRMIKIKWFVFKLLATTSHFLAWIPATDSLGRPPPEIAQ